MLAKLAVGLALLTELVFANCRIGPTYWCTNIPQAAQCNALPFCIQAVWTKEKVNNDTDEVCEICKDMVGQARDTLLSNETQEELREVFEGSCDLIPIMIVRKECKVLVDQFVPELVETLSSEMNPDTVCTVAGLCNSERIDLMLEDMYSKNEHCKTCKTLMSTAQDNLTAFSDVQFEDKMHELCGYFDSYSDACMYTVTTQLTTIRAIIQAWVSPEACAKSVCLSKNIVSVTQYSEDIECEFCTKVVKHWIDVYASDSSLQQFKEILEGLCDKLDKKNSVHCRRIVDDYYMPLFEYIRKVDPEMICSAVGICHANFNLLHRDLALPLTNLFTTKQYLPLTPLLTMKTERKSTCLLCEYVMHNLESYLKDAHNEEEIREYLDGLCMSVPTSYQNVCKTFIDKYEAAILKMISSEIHPYQMCKEINLCSSTPVPKSIKKSSSCQTCYIVAEEVFSVFSDKDDVDMVKNVLESICYRFPEYIDEPCENFVDKYVTAFLKFVAQGLTPDEVCDALDMCNPNEAQNFIKVRDFSGGDSACVICEYTVSYLDKMLEDKNNEEEIREALEAVCDYMPSSVKQQCDRFVDSYTDMIIQLLTGDVTPKEVCEYLGLCQENQSHLSNNIGSVSEFGPVVPGVVRNGQYCAICEYVIQTADQMLEDNKTEKEIEVSLDKVCYLMPSSVKDICVQMVKEYTDRIIHLLVNDYPPEQVCTELSLC